jgi:hypothetical protein
MPNKGGRGANTRDRDPSPRSHPDSARPPARRDTAGVALVAGTGVFESAEQELDARIAPLGSRPSRDHGIGVIELVGPETDLSTIVGGNGPSTGPSFSPPPTTTSASGSRSGVPASGGVQADSRRSTASSGTSPGCHDRRMVVAERHPPTERPRSDRLHHHSERRRVGRRRVRP